MNKINKLICTRVCDFMVTEARKTIIVTVVHRPTGSFAAGAASCAPGDEFDIRVGVPLALKRALSQIKNVNRKAIIREFFRQWPQAHPQYAIPEDVSGCLVAHC